MNYRMRMLAAHRYQLRELLSDTTREQACFLLCSAAQGVDEAVLLVREVIALESRDLRVHAIDQLSVEPAAMMRVARRAQQSDTSVCMVHTHPGSAGSVWFSGADDWGNIRTFEFFHRLMPGRLHSCLVWDGALSVVAGRVYTASNCWHPILDLTVVNDTRRHVFTDRLPSSDCPLQYDRQARLLGKEGQAQFSKLKIAIVGCGGISSVAAVQLVHAGVQDFDLIDFDIVDETNLPRLIGATKEDAKTEENKLNVLSRYILQHDTAATVRPYLSPVEAPELLSVLVSADAIVCGTDDTTSRAFLNQLCHQYYVPILDMGAEFVTDDFGALRKEIGRANLMRPGTPCLACSHHLPSDVLAFEALPPHMQEEQREAGYFKGKAVPQPSMMIFNMQVAARGIQQLVSWVTGVFEVPIYLYEHIHFFGLNTSAGLKAARKRSRSSCPFCGEDAMLLGKGDGHRMLVKPRLRNTQTFDNVEVK